MALRNVDLVHTAAFISSIAATTSDLAKTFPEWTQIDDQGQVFNVNQILLPLTAEQITPESQIIRRKVSNTIPPATFFAFSYE